MSRVGNKIIKLPQGVTVAVDSANLVSIKGPKGELTQQVHKDFKIVVENDTVAVKRPSESKKHKSLHGLYRALIANHVEGTNNGYQKQLELVGVGYKATNQGNVIELNLGYSHAIFFQVPQEIKVTTEMKKGASPLITLNGIDKELIGEVCAKIRQLRKVEPYKGKGIRFLGENIRRKAGKTGAK